VWWCVACHKKINTNILNVSMVWIITWAC
jgi:hypothetical protein